MFLCFADGIKDAKRCWPPNFEAKLCEKAKNPADKASQTNILHVRGTISTHIYTYLHINAFRQCHSH